MGLPGLVEYLTFQGYHCSGTSSSIPCDRLLNVQLTTLLPVHRNTCCVHRFDLPHHYRLLQLFFLPPHPHQVHYSARTPANALLPAHHLALVRDDGCISLHVASVLACFTSFPNSLLELALTLRHDRGQQRRRLWQGHLSGLLDAQLRRHVRPRPRLRECRHGRRSTLDSSVAYLLGHHERQHRLLRNRTVAALLLLGLGVAVATDRDLFSDNNLWHPQQARPQLRYPFCLVRRQHRSISDMLSVYAVEERGWEGEGAGQAEADGERAARVDVAHVIVIGN